MDRHKISRSDRFLDTAFKSDSPALFLIIPCLQSRYGSIQFITALTGEAGNSDGRPDIKFRSTCLRKGCFWQYTRSRFCCSVH